MDLPRWEPSRSYIIHCARVRVVLSQHFAHAMDLVGKDRRLRQQQNEANNPTNASCKSITYLILSIREIFLYQTCTCGVHKSQCTKPETLFNGTDSPSPRALAYLLMLAPPTSVSASSPLHNLSIEIQDMILDSISTGQLEAARIGCTFSLGTPFQ